MAVTPAWSPYASDGSSFGMSSYGCMSLISVLNEAETIPRILCHVFDNR
jgi:hypothetical protein